MDVFKNYEEEVRIPSKAVPKLLNDLETIVSMLTDIRDVLYRQEDAENDAQEKENDAQEKENQESVARQLEEQERIGLIRYYAERN